MGTNYPKKIFNDVNKTILEENISNMETIFVTKIWVKPPHKLQNSYF